MAELLLVTADDPRKTMALGVEKKKKKTSLSSIYLSQWMRSLRSIIFMLRLSLNGKMPSYASKWASRKRGSIQILDANFFEQLLGLVNLRTDV